MCSYIYIFIHTCTAIHPYLKYTYYCNANYIYIYMFNASCSRVSKHFTWVFSDVQETNPGTLCLDACEIHTGWRGGRLSICSPMYVLKHGLKIYQMFRIDCTSIWYLQSICMWMSRFQFWTFLDYMNVNLSWSWWLPILFCWSELTVTPWRCSTDWWRLKMAPLRREFKGVLIYLEIWKFNRPEILKCVIYDDICMHLHVFSWIILTNTHQLI